MADVYINSVTLKKQRLTIGGISFPIIGAYADFSNVRPDANDTVYFTSNIITQIRSFWSTDAFLCACAYRGSIPQPTFSPLVIQDTTSGIQLIIESPTTYTRRVRLNIIEVGNGNIGNAEMGYTASNNYQRIGGPFIMWFDISTGKALVFQSNNYYTYTTSTAISADSNNPNPYGIINSNGFPVCAAPANYQNDDYPEYFSCNNVSPWFYDVPNVTDIETDPYADIDGETDLTGETVGIPSDPGLSVTSTGIVGLFSPTSQQMQDLADFMWTDFGGTGTTVEDILGEIVQALKRSISNPLDYVIGLNIIPSQGLSKGSSKVIRFGFISSNVSMPELTSQFFTVDCGEISFDYLCGNTFLDYAPYSKFSIYLPYIGVKEVDANDFVGHTIGVKYKGDVVTGGLTAFITKDGSVMYQYSGSCALNIPLTADNWGSTISAAINVATAVIGAASMPGAGLAAAAGAAGKAAVGATVSNVAANPSLLSPQVSRSGAISGGAGAIGVQHPYVIREAVRFHSTSQFNTLTGYPSYYFRSLADVSGYTVVYDCHLENIPATDGEIREIEQLLEGGVIL